MIADALSTIASFVSSSAKADDPVFAGGAVATGWSAFADHDRSSQTKNGAL
jgi:hypothetical protein